MALKHLHLDDFHQIIALHNQQSGILQTMRQNAASHAEALADFFLVGASKTSTRITTEASFPAYPGSGHFTRQAFITALGQMGRGGGSSVFDPWEGWWRGKWAGKTEYSHIWDATVPVESQHIQPVTQIRGAEFAWKRAASDSGRGALVSQADIAINVWSSSVGVTGWVTKKAGDGKSHQMPHIGFPLNRNTLIWIARDGQNAAKHFMFFEWVDPSKKIYGIHGRPFEFGTAQAPVLKVNAGSINGHYGQYSGVDPAQEKRAP
ncbi:MAG: hypothetical protein R3C19_02835 [Planctomycetaceae bacterium]